MRKTDGRELKGRGYRQKYFPNARLDSATLPLTNHLEVSPVRMIEMSMICTQLTSPMQMRSNDVLDRIPRNPSRVTRNPTATDPLLGEFQDWEMEQQRID
jgi:hypothetical protein